MTNTLIRRRTATQAFVGWNVDFSSWFSELSNILSRVHCQVLVWIELGDIYRLENCCLMEPDNITIFEINIMLSAWTIHFLKKFSFIELLCQLLTPGWRTLTRGRKEYGGMWGGVGYTKGGGWMSKKQISCRSSVNPWRRRSLGLWEISESGNSRNPATKLGKMWDSLHQWDRSVSFQEILFPSNGEIILCSIQLFNLLCWRTNSVSVGWGW